MGLDDTHAHDKKSALGQCQPFYLLVALCGGADFTFETLTGS